MNKSKYQWFYQTDFLDQELHEQMLDPVNQCVNLGLSVNSDGSTSIGNGEVNTNRYSDNSIFKANIPNPTKNLVELLENKLIDAGVKVPVLFNFMNIIDPDPSPMTKAYGWHKDYNIVEHIQDPLKLWFTMLSLTNDEVNSEFMISPTPEGPEFWNMGVRTIVTSNKLFGHNMNLGHEYFPKDKNHVGILYIRWYDGG
jgi:hypothetical protein